VTSTAARAGTTAGRAGSAAAGAGSAGLGAVAAGSPSRATLETTVRDNRSMIERYGLAAIVFVVAWIALGLEIALIGAVLVVAFEVVLRAIAPTYDGNTPAAAGAPAVGAAPAASAATVAASPVPTPVVEPLEPADPPAPAGQAEASPPKSTRSRTTRKPPSA